MNYYFNVDENVCADEAWLVLKLHEDYPEFSIEDHLENLRIHRDWCGWYACDFHSITERSE